MIDGILNKSLATSLTPPDLVTIHLGTNDCNGNTAPSVMVDRANSLLGHLMAEVPKAQVFLGDVIATGNSWNSCIVAYNALVPGVVAAWAAKGMKVFYVPVHDAMQPGACLSMSRAFTSRKHSVLFVCCLFCLSPLRV